MEELRYSEFSETLHQRLGTLRVPTDATVELTRRCPLRCVHCYNNLPLSGAAAEPGELTTEEHRRILDEFAEAGVLWLLYTGGEIFVREDFLEIYRHAKRNGLLVTLFTNGTLVTAELADQLAQWRPFSIEISLYGRTPQTHDRITQVPGSHERCMRGIQLLLERGLPLSLKTMALTLNRQELGELKRFVEEDLGLSFRFDATVNCRLDCSRSPLSVRLTPQEIVELDLGDAKRVAEWKQLVARFVGPVAPTDQPAELYQCGAGWSSCAVDPWGKMNVCELAQSDSYDLRRGTFAEGWESRLAALRGRKARRRTKCVACGIRSLCGMCPPNGELENGDPEAPADFLCRVAHLRAHAMSVDVPAHGACEYCAGGSRRAELLRGWRNPAETRAVSLVE